MPTFLIALASALLLAALVTESVSRFWPDSYLALLVISAVALLINGLFNARLRQREAVPAEAPAAEKRASDATRDRRDSRDNRNNGRNRNARNRDGNGKPAQKQASKQGSQQKAERDKPEADRETAPRGPEETGEVKWFNRSKGYGFIIRENGDEIFVHQRSIVGSGDRRQRPVLQDGQRVKFVVAHLEKGAQAEQVKPLD